MKYLILILTVLIAGIACQKAIEIDRESVQPKLVINCVLSPQDDTVKLSLTESRDLLYDKYNFPIVADGQVTLFENGNTVGEFVFANGFYELAYAVKPGSTYMVEAKREGFVNVKAETTVKSVLSEVTFEAERLDNNSIDGKIVIEDLKNEDNYFQVTMKYGEVFEDTSILNDPYYQQWLNPYTCTNDYIIEFPQSDLLEGANCNDKFLFSDKTFKNGSHELKLSSEPNSNYYYQDSAKILVVFEYSSMNEDYFSYTISRATFFNNFGNPFAEPVPVYNNIENGYGIFGSSSTFVDSLFLE